MSAAGPSQGARAPNGGSAAATAASVGVQHRSAVGPPEPLLAVEGLRVEFPTRRGTLVAVHDVSFAIAPGEVLGVVGESGAGKSLTGAAIIGLIDPPGRIAAGEIRLAGRRIDNLPYETMRAVRGREIGAVFQDPLTSLNPLYTVGRQLIETIRTHLPMNEAAARKRAVDLLEEVGIPAAARRIEHYPHQFSGGMRQRVVIALALAAKPRLIVADEPTTALDVSIQAQIIQLLKSLCRDHGTAVMLITHDMGVIAETADRVAVMYAGRIVEIGPVAAVIHRPQHPYTVGLMGSIPSIVDERERLTQIDGSMPRLTAIPAGCAFHPRCPHAFERCRHERPELMPAGATRRRVLAGRPGCKRADARGGSRMSAAGPPQGRLCERGRGDQSAAGPPQGARAPDGGSAAATAASVGVQHPSAAADASLLRWPR